MSLPRVDHLILLVEDLDRASADIAALGFTVQERADTKHGTTRFRFVTFEDGSYILITAFTSREAAAGHRLGPVLAEGEGWADYSFAVADLDEAAARATTGGTVLGSVHDVRNVVASGKEWALRLLVAGHGASGDDALPFLIQDVVGRDVRIPAAVPHANGAIGVAEIRVSAPDPAATASRLAALVGVSVATAADGGFSLHVGSCTVTVLPHRPGGPGARRTGGMTSAVLRCRPGLKAVALDGLATHHARIELRPEST
jgi:hypothetical protein